MYGGKLAHVMLLCTNVLCVLTSQDMPVINSDSKNDDNNGKNLSYLKNEFEALTIFLVEELYLLMQVKKLNIEKPNFEKHKYNDILSVRSFTTGNKILKGTK